jgi:hypothetical protein
LDGAGQQRCVKFALVGVLTNKMMNDTKVCFFAFVGVHTNKMMNDSDVYFVDGPTNKQSTNSYPL